jgi:hypothetical protein
MSGYSRMTISIQDFKENGVNFVETCIRASMTSMYEDGAYYFHFSLEDGNVIFETQPVDQGNTEFSVFVEIDSGIFDGCESVEDFENDPGYQEDFNGICRSLYYKALEKIEEV